MSAGAVVLALLSLVSGEGIAAVEESERRRLRSQLGDELCAALDHCEQYGLVPTIAPLRGSACGGCNVALHMRQLLALRSRLGATSCPRCRRIVYDPAWLERESRPAGAAKSGKLARR